MFVLHAIRCFALPIDKMVRCRESATTAGATAEDFRNIVATPEESGT